MKKVMVVMVALAALGAAGSARAQNRYQTVGTGVGVAAGWRNWRNAEGPLAQATFGLTRALDAGFGFARDRRDVTLGTDFDMDQVIYAAGLTLARPDARSPFGCELTASGSFGSAEYVPRSSLPNPSTVRVRARQLIAGAEVYLARPAGPVRIVPGFALGYTRTWDSLGVDGGWSTDDGLTFAFRCGLVLADRWVLEPAYRHLPEDRLWTVTMGAVFAGP